MIIRYQVVAMELAILYEKDDLRMLDEIFAT